MKSGLKYTQSFGKCSEQDTTFSHTCSQRAVGFGVRRQQREKGYPLRAAGANRTVAPGRSAPVTGRPAPVRFSWSGQKVAALKSSKRSGTAEAEFRRPGPLARRRLNAFVFGRGPARAKPGGTPGRGRFLHPFGRPCRCRHAAGMAANGHRRMKI